MLHELLGQLFKALKVLVIQFLIELFLEVIKLFLKLVLDQYSKHLSVFIKLLFEFSNSSLVGSIESFMDDSLHLISEVGVLDLLELISILLSSVEVLPNGK
jgi:Na+-transporting NADH:ubiquinone oxidoreductase subunit NqrD